MSDVPRWHDDVVIEAGPSAARRTPLSRERVLQAAVDLADRGGIEALSMRKLGQDLDVEAMALYRHVRNKDEILDGIVDVIVSEIDDPEPADDWQATLRQKVVAARQVMLRHPWAPRVLEERPSLGPAVLGYVDSVLGILLAGGFSLDLAHHALHVMSSRILGFNQDLFDDGGAADQTPDAAATFSRTMADRYPHLTELAMAASHEGGLGRCDDDVEFYFGLDLMLGGLERLRAAQAGGEP
jgi:AcrR family transcriptional regulator